LRVVEESVTRVRAHLGDVRNQFAAGLVPPNDVSSVAAQESRQRMLAVQARATRDVAEAELGRLVGAAPGAPIQPVSPLEPPARTAPSAAAAIEEARVARAERAGLAQRVAAADERRQAAASQRKPTVGVGGGVDYARPNPRIFPRARSWRE